MNKILLGHGSGGRLTSDLIKKYFVSRFSKQDFLTDSAIIKSGTELLAFTTDSYVIDPIFFPGGNIGKLAVCGTVNDLAVSGATPLFISASFILEEGFDLSDLEKISESMASEAEKAGVQIVTGDTKVVKKGQCDKLFINTSGIGILNPILKSISIGERVHSGDAVLVNGFLGDHAIAILGARENLQFEEPITSDCASLNLLIKELIDSEIDIKFMRDITRGGLATVLAEICDNKKFGIAVNEVDIPVREVIKGTCEVFGFDPLYLANEGKVLIIISAKDATRAIDIMRKNEKGNNASIIGKIVDDHYGKPVLKTVVGGSRIIDKLAGEQLPRIC